MCQETTSQVFCKHPPPSQGRTINIFVCIFPGSSQSRISAQLQIQIYASKFANGKHHQLSDNSSASEITKGVCCTFFTTMSPQVLQLPLAKPFQWPLLFSICTGMEKFQKVKFSGFLCIRHMCNLMAKE